MTLWSDTGGGGGGGQWLERNPVCFHIKDNGTKEIKYIGYETLPPVLFHRQSGLVRAMLLNHQSFVCICNVWSGNVIDNMCRM